MDLLQIFAQKLHCQYLSDLRYISLSPEQANAILEISEADFSLQDYTDAANYILGHKDAYPTVSAAKQAVINARLTPFHSW